MLRLFAARLFTPMLLIRFRYAAFRHAYAMFRCFFMPFRYATPLHAAVYAYAILLRCH